jgi:hypothetical protein
MFNTLGSQVGVILDALRKDQEEHQADLNCPLCEGQGCTWIANGDDDVDPEVCQCVLNTFEL